jgi:hypothetical protein
VDYEPILAPNGKIYFTKQPGGVSGQGEIYAYDPATAITSAINLTNSATNERYASYGGI